MNAAEEALFAAMNRARKAKRLPALRVSAPLARAARAHSEDLRATSRCSHEGSDGSSLQDRLAAVGIVLFVIIFTATVVQRRLFGDTAAA